MSTVGELFAPRFQQGGQGNEEMFAAMAEELTADSVRYLPVESISRAVDKPAEQLCQACITGEYPTPWGQRLYDIALDQYQASPRNDAQRTYENV